MNGERFELTEVVAIVVAAGQGARFGSDVPKQFLLLRQCPILVHTLARFEQAPAVHQVVLVVAAAWESYIKQEILARFQFEKLCAVVPGGPERQDSVFAGLLSLQAPLASLQSKNGARGKTQDAPPKLVVVHDAVRPLFSLELLERVIAGCEAFDACLPGLPPRDTVKRIENGAVVETIPRERLRLAQTPQAFRYQALLAAFETARATNFYGTDEAALIEHAGGRVGWVEGEEANLKITTPRDLQIAELFLQETA